MIEGGDAKCTATAESQPDLVHSMTNPSAVSPPAPTSNPKVPVSFPTIVSERRTVPNEYPIREPDSYRICICGEAPGEDEENHRRPFVGRSGQFLDNLLRDAGIDRHKCLVANVCQVRPPGNRIEAFAWDGPEITNGLLKLTQDIRLYNPHVCLLLGGTPLHAAKVDCKVTDWRGSLFRSNIVNSPFFDRKCIASLHPAFVLREFSGFPLLKFDIKRAMDEARSPDLVLPLRELITNYDCGRLCYLMDTWPAGLRCSVDIEGGLPEDCVNESVKKDSKRRRHIGWRCVALCGRPTKAFAIAWWKFSDTEKALLLRSFAALMRRTDVPKVLQNSLYDAFVMAYGYGILIRHITEDVMLKGWESYCELRKGLSTQASIWTREPHWKDEEMYESTGENLALGCCKDTAVTLEICNAQDQVLKGTSLIHYRKNKEMLNPLLYMELRGIRYDKENVARELDKVRSQIEQVGSRLVSSAGNELRGDKGSLSSQRLAYCLYQQDPGFTPKGKKKQTFEWKTKPYPPQYKKEFGRKTNKLTTDVDALLTLGKKFTNDSFLQDVLLHRHLETLIETLNVKPDFDGRVRCGYNVVGTETGRLTCYTSPTGAGTNLTTITESLRNNYIADPGYDFWQCDLKGADGWTVACHCAKHGDRTMLDDLLYGLQIAKIIFLLYELGPIVNKLDRPSLLNLCRAVDKKNWKSFASKRTQHATNYLVGVPTLCTQVMKDSYKKSGVPVYMDYAQGSHFQSLYKSRYPGLATYQSWCESEVVRCGELTSASGQKRVFFGRRFGKDIRETVGEFISHEPQSNTTWATNLAMLNLWNDRENRRPDGSLIIEPLHQVHDALCGQWPIPLREWAKAKVKSYFQNTLTIASTSLIIPFDGRYGRSWGELTETI